MGNIEYQLKENELTARDFINLKIATGFRDRPIEQVEKALENNLYDVITVCNDKVVELMN